VGVVEAKRAQGAPLAGLAVAKTSAPKCRASWTAAITDAAGCRVDEQALAGLRCAEVDEAVVGGEKDDGDGGGLDEGPAVRACG
jgi:hypothetical protein